MSKVTLKKVEDIEYQLGPAAISGIRLRPAAQALGVSAFGIAVLEIEAGASSYPAHDHGHDEVYVVLKGSATLETGKDALLLGAGTFVRVPPGEERTFLPGPEGVTLLALGPK